MPAAPPQPVTLETLRFDNSYARLPEDFFARVRPRPVADPQLLDFSPEAAALIDLDPAEGARPELAQVVAGSRLLPGSEPLAQVYAGHQFGVYVPRLGDGRALLLGEVLNAEGERWDLQLKGSGPTPYSRMGDGRAVLRSTVREFLASEAMAALGIPTTRALALVGSQTAVYREQVERGAVLLRLAPSHLRFGTFEYFCYSNQPEHLRTLLDYALRRHYPELLELAPGERAAALLTALSRRTARLIAAWQAVGFCHGVLNTDNMSIAGVTLDYGPYGFLDGFDQEHICNHSDHHGRYAYSKQPQIGLWNLGRLAQALRGPGASGLTRGGQDPAELLTREQADAALEDYGRDYLTRYRELMGAKLGLREPLDPRDPLLEDLILILQATHADYTLFWHRLAELEPGSSAAPRDSIPTSLLELFPGYQRGRFGAWCERYGRRLRREAWPAPERRAAMHRVNPRYVLRNYLAEQAIREARDGRLEELRRLRELLCHPFAEQPEHADYAALPPEWAKGLTISCSS